MKAAVLKSRGDFPIGKIRISDPITNTHQDLLYEWPAEQKRANDRIMPDGSIYGLESFQEEASGYNVLTGLYVAKPTELTPAPVVMTRLDQGGGESQLYYQSFSSLRGEWGEVLMAPNGSAIYVNAGTSPPSASRHASGTYPVYDPSGVVNFADRSSRLVSLNADTMKALVSTPLGDGRPLDIALTVDFQIPKTSLPPDTTDPLLIMAPGIVTTGMLMRSLGTLGDVTSTTLWNAVDDSTFGKLVQVYETGLCPYPGEQDQFTAGLTGYPEPDSFLFMNAKPDGSYVVDYMGKPGPPTGSPGDSNESFNQFQVLAGSRAAPQTPFWQGFIRTFETI